MREIKYLVVHCTAGSQKQSVDQVRAYWSQVLHWSAPGYHYLIRPDGSIVELLSEAQVSNGVKGYNSVSINVCYIGGIDAKGRPVDNRTPEQRESLLDLLRDLRARYPRAVIRGHRDFSPDRNGNGVIEPEEWIKSCPCFDAGAEYKNL